MANFLLVDSDVNERNKLVLCARETFAHKTDEDIEVFESNCFNSIKLQIINSLDLSMFEVLNEDNIKSISEIRNENKAMEMFLLADSCIPPMSYINPKIKPTSLLIKPFSQSALQSAMNEFVHSYLNKYLDNAEVLIVKNRDGNHKIPFSKIYYIEVREKKVYIRLLEKEYYQYDTLENILKVLPGYFIRCHRSFVFNTNLLESVKVSENIINLKNNISVPLSRSYKSFLKEYINGLRSK